MPDYYSDKLAAEKLRKVYDIAPPRIRQYLQAEIDYVLQQINSSDRVLELGCGYGRATEPMAGRAALTVGIDTAYDSLLLATRAEGFDTVCYANMDAVRTAFRDGVFNVVVCIQNGISAFHVDQKSLILEALRVTRTGGIAIFSSYAERFWDHRLQWFELQAQHGLLGEIDYDATGDGVIVCRDGFSATTISPDEFRQLAEELPAEVMIEEIDQSSLFCVITKK